MASGLEEALIRVRDDFLVFAGTVAHVKDKSGKVVQFELNRAQLYVHEALEAQLAKTGKVRALILKGRQQGISTLIGARFYHKVVMRSKSAFIVAHEEKATNNLFEMVKRYQEHNPLAPSTKASNAKELVFGAIDAGYKLATAGTDDVGRSNTAQLIHGSEFGFWRNPQKHLAGLGNTVADIDDTEIILESTGNGVGNAFHLMWQDAEAGIGEYIAIFVPWFWQDEYRSDPSKLEMSKEDIQYKTTYGLDDEQMAWRANKIASYGAGFEWLFDQEYPACVSGNARVSTQRGIIRLRDVQDGDYCATGKVVAAVSTGVKEVVKVRTSLGYEVVCTPDHRIAVENGEWLSAIECIGHKIRLQPPRFSDEYAKVEWNILPGSVNGSVVIDERWGKLLGYYMGDGSFYGATLSIACDAGDVDVVADVCRLIGELIGEPHIRSTGKNNGCTEVRIERVALKPLFEALGISRIDDETKNTKRNVCVPECIFRSPKSVVREFLSALFESDGFSSYGHPRVSLFSKHYELLRDVQLLMLGFGITARYSSKPAKNGSGFVYQSNTLDLRRDESQEFGKRIGFVSKRKQGRVEDWISASSGKGRKRFKIDLHDTVTHIEDAGKEEVFDLTVPGPDAFDAGGILVHNCPALAFQTATRNPLISPNSVMAAVTSNFRDEFAPLIIGCDPAGDGANDPDRTAIVFRRGRMVFRVEYHQSLNTMQIAGKLAAYWNDMNPDALFIDKTGLGAGVVDRLNEIGIPAVGVHSGQAAVDRDLYENKKAEMWWTMREWFEDQPVRLPNNAALIADITAPQPEVSSNGRKMLEKKEKLSSRGIRSPDGADALALTFYMPVHPRHVVESANRRSQSVPTTAGY